MAARPERTARPTRRIARGALLFLQDSKQFQGECTLMSIDRGAADRFRAAMSAR
jgi:hypothetical protein